MPATTQTPLLLLLMTLCAAGVSAQYFRTTTARPATIAPDPGGTPDSGGTGPPLSGANVCRHVTHVTVYELRNVTCRCWVYERVSGSCADDSADASGRSWWARHGHSRRRGASPSERRRGRRQASDWRRSDSDEDSDERGDSGALDIYTHQNCYVVRLKTCYRTVRVCTRRRVYRKYCCEGYEDNGRGQCQVIAQCGSDNGGCSQLCVPAGPQGYHCACFPGFTLAPDGKQCVDVDECAVENGQCDHNCENTQDGGYYCSCHQGYILTGPTNCTEVDECANGNAGCQHDCVNTDGGYYCLCEAGYRLVEGHRCDDVNECDTLNGGCSHQCVNRPGWFYCRCPRGLVLEEEGPNCRCPEGGFMPEDDGDVCVCPEGQVVSEDGTQCVLEEGGVIPGPPQGPVDSLPSRGDRDQASLGLLVGLPLAGLFLLAALILAVCCLLRRCRRRRPPPPPPPVLPPPPVPVRGAGGAVGGTAAVAVIKVPLEKKDKEKVEMESEYSAVPGEKKAGLEPLPSPRPGVESGGEDGGPRASVPPSYLEATGYAVPSSLVVARPRADANVYDEPRRKADQPPLYAEPGVKTSPPPRYEKPGNKAAHAYQNLAYEDQTGGTKVKDEYMVKNEVEVGESKVKDTKEAEEKQDNNGVADKIKRFQNLFEK